MTTLALILESSPIRALRHANPLAAAIDDDTPLDAEILLLHNTALLLPQLRRTPLHTLHVTDPALADIAFHAARLTAVPRVILHTSPDTLTPTSRTRFALQRAVTTLTRTAARIAADHTPHRILVTTDASPPTHDTLPLPGGLGLPLEHFDPLRPDLEHTPTLRTQLHLHPTLPTLAIADPDIADPTATRDLLRRLRRRGRPFQAFLIPPEHPDTSLPPLPGLAFVPPHTDRASAIAATDLVIQITPRPADASSLMAALAMRTPCVAPDTPTTRAVVDPAAGSLHPPHDASARFHAVTRLLDDSNLRKMMGARGRASALGRFDRTLRIERLLDAFYR